jgi:aminoglycoside phosphotransferase (APT) family kinase protein
MQGGSVNQISLDMEIIQEIVHRIFPASHVQIERVTEGVSTIVYRVIAQSEAFYLRVLPEENASFAPEVAVHTRLRQMHVKVPEVIFFEHINDLMQRSIMVTTEIKGQSISQSTSLTKEALHPILVEAGRDLALINSILVDGFGWVQRDQPVTTTLQAQWPTSHAFACEYWEADLAFLARTVLSAMETTRLEQVMSRALTQFDGVQGKLAHGDFDTTHIYQHHGCYTGIIDFGEIRGANQWYDLGHFHLRDVETLSDRTLPALVQGYGERFSLPSDYEQSLRLMSILINVRTLAQQLQTRPPNRSTQHQFARLREDVAWSLET